MNYNEDDTFLILWLIVACVLVFVASIALTTR